MSRVADLVAAQPWAITEIYLRGILELAAREPGPAIEQLRSEPRQRLEAGRSNAPEAIRRARR